MAKKHYGYAPMRPLPKANLTVPPPLLSEALYGQILADLHVRLYRRIYASGRVVTVLAGVAALVGLYTPAALGVVGAIGIANHVVKPCDKANDFEHDAQQWGGIARIDDATAMQAAILAQRETEAAPIESLRYVAYAATLKARGYPANTAPPLTLWQRVVALFVVVLW